MLISVQPTILNPLQLKVNLTENDTMHNDAAGAAYIDNFALKVFYAADNEDRAGRASRTTAKSFLAAANFFELLSIFGEISEEVSRLRTGLGHLDMG